MRGGAGEWTCPLPGCANPVTDPSVPCQECLDIFGSMLRPSSRPPLTSDEVAAGLADRDAAVRAAYLARHEIAGSAGDATLWNANQVCWLCEERRKCRDDDHRPGSWVCTACYAGYGPG